MNKILIIFNLAIIMTIMSQPTLAQKNLSKWPIYPVSIIDKYMVYPTGTVTSFKKQKIWMVTLTSEFYVYSRKNMTGVAARAYYKGKGQLRLADKMTNDEYRNLISKNRIYKRCNNTIYKPSVHFKIVPIKDTKTGQYYLDRWDVKQQSRWCEGINVRHHSKDNACEVSCVKYYKGYHPDLKNIRMYTSKSAALADSKTR